LNVIANTVRAIACAVALLPATTACGGAPRSESMPDSTGAELHSSASSAAALPDGSAPEPVLPPPAANVLAAPPCERPAQGCPCDTAGEIAYCEGPVLRDGTFVTCAGLRLCLDGAWGACLPQSFTDPGDAAPNP
jgi:hypothetical protein